MRTTALLVAALIAVGIAATVDALRSEDGREPTPGSATSSISPQAELRRADVTGRLYFAVRNPCEVRGVRFPDLSNAVSFTSEFCRFDVNSAGAVVEGPRCPRDGVRVQRIGETSREFPGCAPAWRPNGDLTFVLDGDVVDAEENILIEDVARFARHALGRGSRLAVQQLAWLTEERVAVVVTTRAVVSAAIVVVEDGRAVSEPAFVEGDATIEVSGDREEFFVGGGFGVLVFNRHGAVLTGSRFDFSDIAAVAESPDGRFVALARPGNLCIYEQIDPPPRERFPVTCLPFDAVDLAWLS